MWSVISVLVLISTPRVGGLAPHQEDGLQLDGLGLSAGDTMGAAAFDPRDALAAANPDSPPETLRYLAEHDPDLHQFIITNPAAPKDLCAWIKEQGDPKVLPYTARFAYFFRAEFFPKRLFEVLNAEHKPEQAGFRRARDDIFRNLFLFEKKNIPSSKLYSSREEDEKEDENEEKKAAEEDEAFEEGLLEWLYDDMMIELQLPRLLAFLAFLGIVKPVYNQF